jgi:hypothetical protein
MSSSQSRGIIPGEIAFSRCLITKGQFSLEAQLDFFM